MTDGPVLGIDLGTTNSVVAVADGGQSQVIMDPEGRRLVPSVVSFHPGGATLVGYPARERRLVDAVNTVYAVKRLIGRPYDSPEVRRAQERFAFQIEENRHGGCVVVVRRGRYALAEVSAMVLRELRRFAELSLGEPTSRAVITVPANFNELQRSATKAAGKVAGLDVLRILNEPTAAALAYGLGQQGRSEKVAVYDLGGGTFDITILELERDVFEVVATAGDTFLGGDDLDVLIAERMSDVFVKEHRWDPRTDKQAFERLRAAAEWAKCQLSRDERVELTVEELTHGAGGVALDLHFALTREELEEIAGDWVERTFRVCEEALTTSGFRLDDLDGVVLVGGSTRMPMIRRRVEEFFGREPRIDIDPDMVVAQGAAIHGFTLGGRPPQAKAALGRMGLRRVTKAELERIRSVKSDRKDGRPKQPAFAPADQDAPFAGLGALEEVTRRYDPRADPRAEDGAVPVTEKITVEGQPQAAPGSLGDLGPAAFDSTSADAYGDISDPFQDPAVPSKLTPSPTVRRQPPPIPPAARRASERPPPRPGASSRPPPLPPPAGPPADVAEPDNWRSSEPPRPRSSAPPRAGRPTRPGRLRPPPAPRASLDLQDVATPLLMDVTPLSLGVETAGGYMRRLIPKNAPVPTEQMRTFTTAKDHQEEVAVRICQGEEDMFDRNQVLGEVLLTELPSAPRGQVQIEVAFILDADGTLRVDAKDVVTGRAQSTHINLRGGLSDDEIDRMRQRQQQEMA
ncbi:MAG: Hsp70 family protein [Sandaracinaceae bacterium]